MNFIYGFLEDSTFLTILYWVKASPYFTTSEPLLFYPYFFITNYLNSIFFFNFYLLFTFILNLIFTFKFFKLFSNSILHVSLVSIIFNLSPFFYYKFQNHLNLISVWLLVYFLYRLVLSIKNNDLSYKSFLINGFVLSTLMVYSNYLGYIGMLTSVLYFVFILFSFKLNFTDFLKKGLSFGVSFFSLILIFNYNYIFFNFISTSEIVSTTPSQNFGLKRNIDDFFIFSSRPWYFFLPSIDNPFFGFITKDFLEKFSGTNFLFNNYFKSEHSSSFLGILNVFLLLFSIAIFYNKNKTVIFNNIKIYFFSLTIFIYFVLLALPPYLDIIGFRLYLPGYLLYSFFPMFRVTSRFGIISLLFALVFVLKGYELLEDKFKNKKIIKPFIFTLFFVSLLEFYIPIKVSYFNETPEAYVYAKDNLKDAKNFMVYPPSRSSHALFWTKEFNKPLINMYGNYYKVDGKTLDNSIFTKLIFECNYIHLFYNVDYFFVHINLLSEEEKVFFNNTFTTVFESNNNLNFEIEYNNLVFFNIGNSKENIINIYKLNNLKNCE